MSLTKDQLDENFQKWIKKYSVVPKDKLGKHFQKLVKKYSPISNLTKDQAIKIIDSLEGKKAYRKTKDKMRKKSLNDYMRITTRQLEYIKDLKEKAGWDDGHLNNFVRKYFNQDDIGMLTSHQAGVVIEVLEHCAKKHKETL
ncbi:MAG: hypothetical protein SCARUB_04088 [Candidatus Scalindua rubra]|uniref:DUF1018 domain-containing protein n=1 Tax=Candidatus Scalindua rubra TaxID=1872076 RepID=A0A1E3X5B6_9BACT|nr:MAG: hypothetical protein SCARUB_04088 [Candidatus Scalindua rubra]